MECFTVGSFFQWSLNDQWLVHPSIQTASSPDLCNDVVDANIVRCFQLRKSCLLNLVNLGDVEEFSKQLFAGLRLYEDDELISRIMKIDTPFIERCFSEWHIRRQDGDFLGIFFFVFLSILNEIPGKRLFIVNIQSQRVNSRIISCSKEVRIAAVQLEVLMHPQICCCLDVAQKQLAVENDMQVTECPCQLLRQRDVAYPYKA